MVLRISAGMLFSVLLWGQLVTPPPGGSGGGGGGTIATTPNILKGDNAGNAVATGCSESSGSVSCTGSVSSGSGGSASGELDQTALTSGNVTKHKTSDTAAAGTVTYNGITGNEVAATGSLTSGHCANFSGTAGLIADAGAACGSGSGTTAASNVTPVTVSANSTSPQILQQLTLASGILNNAGAPYTYNGSGIYTAAALQTPTLTWTLNACTVSGCGSGTVRALATLVTPSVVTATNNSWKLQAVISNTATGASGTLITHASMATVLTIGNLATVSNDTNTASSSTIDLTGVVYLQLTITTSTGNAGNSITEDHCSLEPASSQGVPGPTGGNFVLISSQTLGSPAATVTFSGISGFKHLKMEVQARCSDSLTNDNIYMQFNGETAAVYNTQIMFVSGSTGASGFQETSMSHGLIASVPCASALANTAGSSEITIPNSSGTIFSKLSIGTGGAIQSSGVTGLAAGYFIMSWNSVNSINAITQIVLGMDGGSNFVANSVFTLYGMN